MSNTKIQFRGTTERGRQCVEDSLTQCLKTLADITDRRYDDLVTTYPEPDLWRVYATQAALDMELQRLTPTNWFAVIRAEVVS